MNHRNGKEDENDRVRERAENVRKKNNELRPLTIYRPQNRCFLSPHRCVYHSSLFRIKNKTTAAMRQQKTFGEKGIAKRKEQMKSNRIFLFLINENTFLVPMAQSRCTVYTVCFCDGLRSVRIQKRDRI